MYTHKVQYYETDKMGITHHSNYIRWMEEARIDFLEKSGFSYDKLEKDGIISPVISVECSYKKTTTFSDEISIEVTALAFNGIKLKLGYVMKNAEGVTVCEASSCHCFLNTDGCPVRLKKEFPEFYSTLASLV